MPSVVAKSFSVLYHPSHTTLGQLMYNAILFIKSIGKKNLQMNVKPEASRSELWLSFFFILCANGPLLHCNVTYLNLRQ